MSSKRRKNYFTKIINLSYSIILAAMGVTLWLTGDGGDKSMCYGLDPWGEKEETVTDFDGNVYPTVTIGTQVWMAANLKVSHYRDGTPIPNVYSEKEWSHAMNGAYCTVGDDLSEYKDTHGFLYNFYAVDNNRGLSPEGWHVPSAKEWKELIDYLGGNEVAGGKMKDIRSKLWKIHTLGASNESGFSALPSGGRGRLGSAGEVGYYATWWSSTSYDSIYAWHWGLYPDNNKIRFNPGHKASGFSVRCVKDP
jgi:uncharacterized protein (TIGR02145 family)